MTCPLGIILGTIPASPIAKNHELDAQCFNIPTPGSKEELWVLGKRLRVTYAISQSKNTEYKGSKRCIQVSGAVQSHEAAK